jgi:opacity protein-like surface antigen
MKKIALVVALATSAAMAAPFNGFSVGGSVGAVFSKYKAKLTNASTSKTNLLLNVFTGYTKSFDNMIAGVDVALGYERLELDLAKLTASTNYSTIKPRALSLTVNPRIGYKFDETTAAYFKMGLGFSSINFSQDIKDAGVKPTVFVVRPVVGVEKFFNENVSVRGEVGYKFEKINTKDGSPARTAVKDIKKHGVLLTVGVAHTF